MTSGWSNKTNKNKEKKCLPGLLVFGTLVHYVLRLPPDSRAPSATTTAGPLEQGHRQLAEFSVLHIVLIAVGGVVFFIGIIIIIVLLKSRKKFCANNTNPNRGNAR